VKPIPLDCGGPSFRKFPCMPSSPAEHCRQKAAECEEEAKRALSSSIAATGRNNLSG
jgi:hypothetical protein